MVLTGSLILPVVVCRRDRWPQEITIEVSHSLKRVDRLTLEIENTPIPGKKTSARLLVPLAIDHYTVFPGGWISFPIDSKLYVAPHDHLRSKKLNVGGGSDEKATFSVLDVHASIDDVRDAFRDFDYRSLK
jgi:hypothetical protein